MYKQTNKQINRFLYPRPIPSQPARLTTVFFLISYFIFVPPLTLTPQLSLLSEGGDPLFAQNDPQLLIFYAYFLY